MPDEITKSQALAALMPSFSLSGKKTYIVGVLLCAFGGYLVYTGQDDRGTQVILNGLGLMGLRAAVTKSGPEPIANLVSDMVAKAIDLQPPCKEELPVPTPPPAAG